MIEVKDKKKCCGCTACYSICPKKAIKMIQDIEGFLYPKVDKEKCIDCHLCEKVCPIINNKESKNTIIKSYAIRLKNNNDLIDSTSGGFFTAIASYILTNKGIVYGVGFDKSFKIIHKKATKYSEIIEMRGSKYVQSYLGNSFSGIKQELENGKLVLFTGTPCQVAGLKKYLIKEYKNLITLDLVCHGVPSPKLWGEYIKYQEDKFNSKIKSIKFRNKTYGYHSGTMKISFENGKDYYGSARIDYYLKSFFNEIASRPSCYDCPFKTKNHISDFTVFDCWSFLDNIENSDNKIDDDKGYTNLFVNTEKGLEIFEKLEEYIHIHEINADKSIKNDGTMLLNSVKKHKNRDLYYDSLNKYGLVNTIKRYIPVSKKDYLIEKTKKILYSLNLISKIKKIKDKLKKG